MGAKGLVGRGVPPGTPQWLLFVKIAILVLALVVLALAAYSISVFGSSSSTYTYYGGTGAGGLLIFVAILTFIVFGLAVAIEIWAPRLFFRLLALIAYCLTIVFWLSAWAWAASVAGYWLSLVADVSPGKLSLFGQALKNAGGAMAGAAAMGAIAWILSIVVLVFFILACIRDPEHSGAQQAELGQVPAKAQEGQPAPVQAYDPAYPQQQPVYQQQPAYGQPQQAYGQPQPVYGQPQQYQQ